VKFAATRLKTVPVPQMTPPIRPSRWPEQDREKIRRNSRFSHERILHEIDIPEKAGEQRPERKENANAVGTQGVSLVIA